MTYYWNNHKFTNFRILEASFISLSNFLSHFINFQMSTTSASLAEWPVGHQEQFFAWGCNQAIHSMEQRKRQIRNMPDQKTECHIFECDWKMQQVGLRPFGDERKLHFKGEGSVSVKNMMFLNLFTGTSMWVTDSAVCEDSFLKVRSQVQPAAEMEIW